MALTMSSESNENVYETLGGEAGVRRLVKRFYELMDLLPEARTIREMHPADLSGSEEKLFLFLSGWTGGPQLYIEKHGPPMLRRRHFPFAIGERERDQWMLCMYGALKEAQVPEPLFTRLVTTLHQFADHMRNQDE